MLHVISFFVMTYLCPLSLCLLCHSSLNSVGGHPTIFLVSLYVCLSVWTCLKKVKIIYVRLNVLNENVSFYRRSQVAPGALPPPLRRIFVHLSGKVRP